jgi:hypothetical protein
VDSRRRPRPACLTIAEQDVAAYIISRVNIVDGDSVARYMAEAPQTVNAFGGRYLVRGNACGRSKVLGTTSVWWSSSSRTKLPRSRGTPPRSTGRCVISGSGATETVILLAEGVTTSLPKT